jgi:hypothetical protein
VRRVFGEVIMYDLLDSGNPVNKAPIEVNMTQWEAKCLINE